MEIEAKFRVGDQEVFTRLLAMDRLGDYALQPAAGAQEQQNTYYDTDDGRLRAARYGLRVRAVDDRSLVTLKGPGSVEAGVHQRAEWEFPADTPDPVAWPDSESEAREKVRELVGTAALRPILTIQTSRQHIFAMQSGNTVAELSLDQSTINAAGKTRNLRELEVELVGDSTQADLDALVTALREHFTLVPEEQSKLEQGLALLDQ